MVGQAATPGGVAVTLADGEHAAGALLVGCDGRESQVARRAGIRRRGWDYGQTSLVCAVAHERPHGGMAHQFFMPAGPLAILPLPGNRSSIVWTEAQRAGRGDRGWTRRAISRRCGRASATSWARSRWRARATAIRSGCRSPRPGWRERLALAGDAAHGIHPLAGQGLNLGLRDVAALAEVVVAARRRGQDIGAADVLAEYQRWRRFDTALLAAATDGLNRLFSNDNPLLRLGRDLGLGLVNRLPALRRALIAEAAGVSGDLPLAAPRAAALRARRRGRIFSGQGAAAALVTGARRPPGPRAPG